MNRFKFYGIVLVLFMFACNNKNEEDLVFDSIIKKAETVYQHPDGERYDTEEADTIQITLKIIQAAHVFEAKNDFAKASKAFLFYGYAQKEANDKVSAMKAFKDAEHYGKLSGDSLTTARAQFNIARSMFVDHEYDESCNIAAIADKNFQNHYEERAFVHNLMASACIMQKNYEDAELHLKQGLVFVNKSNSTRAKQKILNNYSVFYREQGDYEQAIRCLRQNLKEANGNTLAINYLNIGLIYIYNDQFDSAAFYTQKALDLSNSIKVKPETEVSIYFSLYFIAKMQGQLLDALAYLEKQEALQYKVLKNNEQKNVYRIQKQYDYEVLQNQMHQKIIAKQRIILIISFLLLLASIIVIGLLVRQKKILKEDERIRKELNKTKEELQKSVKAEVVEKELSRQIHLIITANQIAKNAADFKKEWSPLVYKINNEKDNMFEAAMVAIERVYPDMYATIRNKYPNLNETEAKVMLLSCSDLSNKEIAGILGLSIYTVNKCRSEINRKIM